VTAVIWRRVSEGCWVEEGFEERGCLQTKVTAVHMIAIRVPVLIVEVMIDDWRCWKDRGDTFYEGPF
jgi:hypothetical protein